MDLGVRTMAIRETMLPFDGWRDIDLVVLLEVAEPVSDLDVRIRPLLEVATGDGRE